MDCDQFDHHWTSFVAGGSEAQTREAMVQHTLQCAACRERWQAHEEVQGQLKAIFRTKSPEELAKAIERRIEPVPLMHSGMTNRENGGPNPATTSVRMNYQVVAALLCGILIGIVLTSALAANLETNSNSTAFQQYALFQAANNGYSSPRIDRLMQAAALQRRATTGAAGFRGLPAFSTATRLALCLMLVHGAARTRLWEVFLGTPVPRLLLTARVLALLALVLGVALMGFTAYFQLAVLPSAITRNSGADDIDWMLSTQGTLHEAWSLACWLTVFCLLFVVLQAVAQVKFGRFHK